MSTKQKSRTCERTAENIQVVVRCRPISKLEMSEKQTQVCHSNDKDKEIVVQLKSNKMTKAFFFDSVYGPKSTQREVYMGTVLPIVEEVLEGYNCTLFAYGQTGTGKTYTMEGPREPDVPKALKTSTEAGIITRSINTIFDYLHKCGDEYTVKVSHLELYNEELCDLLNPENKSLKIYSYEDNSTTQSGITVHNLTELPVYNAEDIFAILERSWNERRTAETLLNKSSSRSHCIFSITIHMREITPEGEEVLKMGKLNLVDLAGSENIGKSGAKSFAKTEAGMINKSLLTLGRVITALTEHSPHIPYRESKLTRLLQDSLGGTTKTCIIATISPASGGLEDTLSTLDYAFRAKNIRNQPQVNKKVSKKEVIREYTCEISELRAQLDAARKKDGVHLPVEQYDKLMTEVTEKGQKIEMFQDMLEMKEKELSEIQELFHRQVQDLDRTKAILEETTLNLDKTTNELKSTESTLENTKVELEETKFVLNEYKITEKQFHSEAEVVLETLDVTLGDIEGLFKKIERQDNLSQSNIAAFEGQKRQLVDRVCSVEDNVKAFVAEQSAKYASLVSSLEAFIENKHTAITQIGDEVKNLKSDISKSMEKLDSLSRLYCEESLTNTTSMQKQLDARQNDMKLKTTALQNLSNQHSVKVQEEVTAYQNVSSKLAENNLAQIKDSSECAKSFVNKHTSDLASVHQKVSGQIYLGVGKLSEQNDTLNQFLIQQKEEEEILQNSVINQMKLQMEQMQLFLSKVSAERESKMTYAINGIKNQMISAISEMSNLKETCSTSTKQLQTSAKDFGKDLEDRHVQIANGVTSSVTSTDIFASQLKVQLVEYSSASTQDMDLLTKGLNSDFYLQKSHVDQSHMSFVRYAKEFDSVTKIIDQDTTGETTNICDALKKIDESVAKQTQSWVQQLDNSTQQTRGFKDSYVCSSGQLKEQFHSFVLQKYIPTTTTPAKKTFTYPQNLSKTRPEPEIVAQFKNGGVPVPSTPLPIPTQNTTPIRSDVDEHVLPESISPVTPSKGDTVTVSNNKAKPKRTPGRPSPPKPGRGRGGKQTTARPTTPGRVGRAGDGGRENTLSVANKRVPIAKNGRNADTDTQRVVANGGTSAKEASRTRLGDVTNQVKS